jgi:hypothetical protein
VLDFAKPKHYYQQGPKAKMRMIASSCKTMIRAVSALMLLMLCAADAQFIIPQPAPVLHPGFRFNSSGSNLSSSANIGINTPIFAYYSTWPLFADIFQQNSGNFGQWDCGNNFTVACTVDSTGAPTQQPARTQYPTAYPSGTYTLTYTGSVGAITSSCWTLGSPTVNGSFVSYPATITQDTSLPNEFCNVVVNTVPISNIHMFAPGDMTTGDFLTGFLMKFAPFSNLRWLDALQMNACGFGCLPSGANGTQNWLDRTFPGTGTAITTRQGFIYDYLIEYANITGKDIYLNIPYRVTDNYMCRLARLFFYGESGANDNGSNCSTSAATSGPYSPIVPQGINTTSHIHIEYVNELWNYGSYPAPHALYCVANGGPQSGDASCPDGVSTSFSPILTADLANNALPWTPTATDPFCRQQQVAADMAKRNGDIFKAVFGSRSAQVKPVLGAWLVALGTPTSPACGAQFLLNAYGSVVPNVAEIAVAPYMIDPGTEATDCGGPSVSTCINMLMTSITYGGLTYGFVQQDATMARFWNVPLITYEGGPNFTLGARSFEATVAADPQMYDVVRNNWVSMWGPLANSNSLFNYYQACENEMWGALVNCVDRGSQRWDAMLSLILTPGDANYDGTIDISDCDIVLFNQGLASGAWWEDGDFNNDGAVGTDDLAILNQHFPGGNCGNGQGQAVMPANSLQHYYK